MLMSLPDSIGGETVAVDGKGFVKFRGFSQNDQRSIGEIRRMVGVAHHYCGPSVGNDHCGENLFLTRQRLQRFLRL